MKYFVLGGYGAMGKIIVKDLFETTNDEIIIAGRDLKEARKLTNSYKSIRVKAVYADTNNHESMVKAFKGSNVVIHAVHHEFNVKVMKACLAAKTNYDDLGGLYHWIKPQLRLNKQFKKANLTAVISIGASPGITDILAAYGASKLDKVKEVHIRMGDIDKTDVIRPSPLASSYSIQTIFEEFSYKPAVLTKGKVKFVEPMSGREDFTFPKPVGAVKPMYTIHSEIATIPYVLKGLKECDFKIAFNESFVEHVKLLKDLGFLSERPIIVNGKEIIPKDVTVGIIKNLPKPVLGKPDQYEIIRVIVNGIKNGKKKTIILDCRTAGMPKWNIGIDIDTGAPASIAAQFIANRTIREKGVLTAGKAIPSDIFFKELKKRGMNIYLNNRCFR